MNRTPLTLTIAAALVATSVTPAMAQYTDPEAERQYRERVDDYNEATEAYEERRSEYDRRREAYAENRADYQRQRADYERARADYDRRYGRGAFERRYGVFVYHDNWADNYWYDYRYRGYRWDDRADYRYGRDDYYRGYRDSPCERSRDRRSVGGALIGALAGAAIGSNLDDDGNRAEGTVLGALVGGAIGSNIGRNTAKCDARGYYWTYDQTYPYRERGAYRGYRSGNYDYNYYSRQRCRLAIAPVDYRGRTDYRYVRVCPDSRGRYRITR